MRILKPAAAVLLTAAVIFTMNSAASARNAPVAVLGVLPTVTSVYDSITLRGTVTELDRRELLPPAPARVETVYARVGERVYAGQTLMRLVALTAAADTGAAVYADIESAVSAIIEEQLTGSASDYKNQSAELAAAMSAAIGQTSEAGAVYEIVSPIDGILMEIAPVGTQLSGIRACAAVSDLTRLAISALASEDSVGAIAEGMPCVISVDALGLEGMAGTVELVMPYARTVGSLTQVQQTKTEVCIVLDSPSESLRPGYSAVAKIAVNVADNAVMAPLAAIGQDEQNREYVMVLENGVAVKKYIETGREMDDCAEVKRGITADEILILSPQSLKHGQKVVIK